MFTILRRIRKSLIESGATRRYFLYAIGEIALVVIGILIALQINNWNTERINSNEEQRILFAIADEIQGLNWKTDRGISSYTEVLTAANSLLFAINEPSLNTERDSLDHFISLITTRWLMGKGNSTNIYDALIGSGELGLITSSQLQNNLNVLNRDLLLLASYEGYQTAFVDDHLYPILNKHIDALTISKVATLLQAKRYRYDPSQFDLSMHSSRFDTDYDTLLNSREFANQLVQLMQRTAILLPIYGRIKDNMAEIDSILVLENSSININHSGIEE